MPLNVAIRHRANSVATTLNSHRFLVYSFISTLAVSAVVANALRSYSNFYSVAISLSKSNRSVLALINFGFLIALVCGHVVQRLFFGTLRPNEVERLYDRLWFFITESLLAFTIFRDEFDIPFVVMFGFLLFVKSFHWLAGDRIEWMDQRPYPGPPLLFHIRMSTLFIILWITDFVMFLIAIENTLAHGVGGMVLFASEYGILMASVLNTISKYLLSAYELRRAGRRGGENAPPWEHKSMWVFYIELGTDFLKLTTYLIFFTIIIAFYGLPLNIVRDVYITARSFISRLRALHRYQTATRNMDQRYPNATPEELTSMSDRTCIICREEMISHEATRGDAHIPAHSDGPNTTPKKLPCGHIFHFHCLRSWLERQQSCPTCRRTVLDSPPHDQNPGARAPPPAADPQRANPIVPAARLQDQDQPAVNNPLGHPLGLIGRFFAPPVLQPVAPAENNAPQNHGNYQEVVIQYHIQYQPQLHQQPNVRQTLQPPPPFPGFPGPGGVWQPWPTGPAHPRENGPDPGGPPPTNVQSANVYPLPNPNINPEGPSPPPNGPPQTPSAASHSRDENDQVARRDAAALAALRRLNNNVTHSSAPSPTVPEIAPRGEGEEPGLTSIASSPAASSSHTSLPGISSVPSLIPLYTSSGSPASANRHTSPDGVTSSTLENHEVSRSRAMHAGNVNQLSGSQIDSSARNEATNTSDNAFRLPSALSDEQLATMDRLTREAIDERLRVLEDVSRSVYRCADDLMRMRSALPLPTARTNADYAPSVHPEPSPDNKENGIRSEMDPRSAGPSGNTRHGKAPETSKDLSGPEPPPEQR